MELEQRITKLENLVSALIADINRKDSYTNADVNGVRTVVSNITPYMESKKAYIGDTSCIFNNVREGNVTAYMVTDSGLAMPTTIVRSGDSVVVSFEKLEEVATVTISVL